MVCNAKKMKLPTWIFRPEVQTAVTKIKNDTEKSQKQRITPRERERNVQAGKKLQIKLKTYTERSRISSAGLNHYFNSFPLLPKKLSSFYIVKLSRDNQKICMRQQLKWQKKSFWALCWHSDFCYVDLVVDSIPFTLISYIQHMNIIYIVSSVRN